MHDAKCCWFHKLNARTCSVIFKIKAKCERDRRRSVPRKRDKRQGTRGRHKARLGKSPRSRLTLLDVIESTVVVFASWKRRENMYKRRRSGILGPGLNELSSKVESYRFRGFSRHRGGDNSRIEDRSERVVKYERSRETCGTPSVWVGSSVLARGASGPASSVFPVTKTAAFKRDLCKNVLTPSRVESRRSSSRPPPPSLRPFPRHFKFRPFEDIFLSSDDAALSYVAF